jgi:Glycosyltransferase like family
MTKSPDQKLIRADVAISEPGSIGCSMNWTLISATNNERILKNCLLNSPDVKFASEVLLQTGYANAANAYNAAIDKANTDVLVFAHQDVYLPEGWIAAVQKALGILSKNDPEWAVLGVWGIQHSGSGAGHLYCAGLMKRLGEPFDGVKEVASLDEVILIVRKSSGLRFDERLSGFHLYGTDICLGAKQIGKKCYAISAFCVHNTNGYNFLPFGFWRNYFFMRRKWKALLPIITSCTKITFWCWPMVWWNIDRALNLTLRRHNVGVRVEDPSNLYRNLVAQNEQRLMVAFEGSK